MSSFLLPPERSSGIMKEKKTITVLLSLPICVTFFHFSPSLCRLHTLVTVQKTKKVGSECLQK